VKQPLSASLRGVCTCVLLHHATLRARSCGFPLTLPSKGPTCQMQFAIDEEKSVPPKEEETPRPRLNSKIQKEKKCPPPQRSPHPSL